jgi:hypothetical protein
MDGCLPYVAHFESLRRSRAQPTGIARRIFFAAAKLIEIIVVRDVLIRRNIFVSRHTAFLHDIECGKTAVRRAVGRRRPAAAEHCTCGCETYLSKEMTAVGINGFRRDFRRFDGVRVSNLDQHDRLRDSRYRFGEGTPVNE